jgi:hypothetical protein
MNPAPLSVLHTISDHYIRDAQDFLERFDLLWERMLHKMGRTKSFVDLLFACECALKAHFVLGRIDDDPVAVYKAMRALSHDVAALAGAAQFIQDRGTYQFVSDRLGPFSVLIRYSLDAYETFFPSAMERAEADINYSNTIGNNAWVLECRSHVATLIDSTAQEDAGFVTTDLEALFQHELEMKAFVDACMR